MANRSLESVAIDNPVRPPPPTADLPSFPRDPNSTEKDDNGRGMACLTCIGFIIIPFALVTLVAFVDEHPHYHANFSVQSISVSPFNLSGVSRWNVDFHVKNPTWRCRIDYEGDVGAKLSRDGGELLYGAVFNASRRKSGRHSVFSVDFAAARGKDPNHVVPDVFNLDVKVAGRIRHIMIQDYAGYHTMQCRNLTVGFSPDSMSGTMLGGKKKCKSSFSPLKLPL